MKAQKEILRGEIEAKREIRMDICTTFIKIVINIPFIVIFSFYCSKFINYLYYRYV
jgi:hypothetical protein